MKNFKIAVAFTCALAMLLTFGSNAFSNNSQSKPYATGTITLYNNGDPAI